MCAFFRDVESHAAPATLSVDFSRARLRGGWRGREGLVAPRVSIRAAARARGGFDWRARAPPPRSERGRRCARPRWGVPAHTEVEETEGPEGRVHDDCLMVPRPPLSPLARSPCSHTSASPRGGAHDCPTAHDCSTTQLLNCARLLNCLTAHDCSTAQLLNCLIARLLNTPQVEPVYGTLSIKYTDTRALPAAAAVPSGGLCGTCAAPAGDGPEVGSRVTWRTRITSLHHYDV